MWMSSFVQSIECASKNINQYAFDQALNTEQINRAACNFKSEDTMQMSIVDVYTYHHHELNLT